LEHEAARRGLVLADQHDLLLWLGPLWVEARNDAYRAGYVDAQEAYDDERERIQRVVSAPGVLAAMRGYLEVPDQEEFVGWLLSAVRPGDVTQVTSLPPPELLVTPELVDMLAERVALKLQGTYGPPALTMPMPPTPTFPTPAPVAPAATLDLNRLTPLQRALVNAMLPQGR
jgi:hypothetical protein